ncbi:hypothetical protein [Streptomyces cyanogenus]|uniref:hypothetical protein n=1 Tax=Streptomyces cyanogenus TaxID=80860 RepID=UPI001AA15EC8|nr:hypothetical protein [Streptomyces cyanogenus]
MSGSRDGQPWPKRGEAFDVSDEEGASLCASGIAEPVGDKDRDVERAVPGDAEKRGVPTFDGPVGDAYLPKDGGRDPVVQGQKDVAMVAAEPENRDVAARADDQHPPHEVTQDVEQAQAEKPSASAAESKPRRSTRAKPSESSKGA